MTEGQIINKISIENVMGIRRLTYSPQEPVIFVEGNNGAGKSSFTSAAQLVLGSTDDAKRITNLVKKGESKATVVAELTNMTVTKVWNASGKSRVDIVSKEGARFSNPAEMLKSFTGPLPFDPTKLMDQSSKEMMNTFVSMIHTDTDFEQLAQLKDSLYKERTIINRQKKAAMAKRDGYSNDYPDVPEEELSMSNLSHELTSAMAVVARHKQDIVLLERADTEITILTEKLVAAKEGKAELETSLSNYEDPQVSFIQDNIDRIEETNKQVRYMQNKADLTLEYDQLDEKSKQLSGELEDIQKTKEWELSNAEIPIEGLTFDEDTIMFNGIPLSDCCTAERLEACVAICIGTHPNQKNGVKVMFINHGNNLDAGNLKRLGDLCTKEGYQVWIEMVTEKPSGTGVFIEDGEIKNGA